MIGEFDHSPAFMSFEPLSDGRYWLLLVWIPYWILTYSGKSFCGEGYVTQAGNCIREIHIIHGFGLGLFHVAFGWQLLITLIP